MLPTGGERRGTLHQGHHVLTNFNKAILDQGARHSLHSFLRLGKCRLVCVARRSTPHSSCGWCRLSRKSARSKSDTGRTVGPKYLLGFWRQCANDASVRVPKLPRLLPVFVARRRRTKQGRAWREDGDQSYWRWRMVEQVAARWQRAKR
jgi:hypothetical protein